MQPGIPESTSTTEIPLEPPAHPLVAALRNIRTRIIGGVLLIAPAMITFWIIFKLYELLRDYVMSPAARLVISLARDTNVETELPATFRYFVAPVFGLSIVLLTLYFLGLVVRSRLHRVMNWIFLHLPVVTTVYRAVSNVFSSIESQAFQRARFKRVVLVPYPHAGVRVAGFVTAIRRDPATQKKILCVYLPTAPFLTSGLVLLVPEESVINTSWTLEQALQATVSWGMAMPPEVPFESRSPARPASLEPPASAMPAGPA